MKNAQEMSKLAIISLKVLISMLTLLMFVTKLWKKINNGLLNQQILLSFIRNSRHINYPYKRKNHNR